MKSSIDQYLMEQGRAAVEACQPCLGGTEITQSLANWASGLISDTPVQAQTTPDDYLNKAQSSAGEKVGEYFAIPITNPAAYRKIDLGFPKLGKFIDNKILSMEDKIQELYVQIARFREIKKSLSPEMLEVDSGFFYELFDGE